MFRIHLLVLQLLHMESRDPLVNQDILLLVVAVEQMVEMQDQVQVVLVVLVVEEMAVEDLIILE